MSGGLIAAGPARFGLAAYSPRLDPTGTSVRGRIALRALSERLGLHLMHNPALAASTVTLVTTADDLPSAPTEEQERALREQVAVVAAQGALDFTAAERVLYALDESGPEETASVVLDLRQVTGIDTVARSMLRSGLARLTEGGRRTAVVDPVEPPRSGGRRPGGPRRFTSREEAVERAAREAGRPTA